VFEAATRAAVLVRDLGHGGVGAAYDKDGKERRESHQGKRRSKKGSGVGGCCVIT
jgi:Rho family protein